MKFKPLQIGLQYKALDSGDIQGADVFTTDGQLSGDKYVVLSDPKKVFGFQNVAPVVKSSLLSKEGPEFAETLNAVSAKLTLEAIRQMNAAVDIDKKDPADVASSFLSANGLK
jgi:osmoprotectant transport system substrate-binding protein